MGSLSRLPAGPRSALVRSRFAALGGVAACAIGLQMLTADSSAGRPQPIEWHPAPGGQPVVRVSVALDRESITVSSRTGLRLSDALTDQPAGEVAPQGTLRVHPEGGVLHFAGDLTAVAVGVPSVVIRPVEGGSPIAVDGRPYRGIVEVKVSGAGRLTAINILPLEDYLLGVVPLEIGPREPEEMAAVEAQAVAARTYAVSHMGRHDDLGFDLYGSVEDQVYGGMSVELEESTRAVRNTAGAILMYEGRPIRAFYHSTCGGRTAAVEEVMDREPAPYLRSVSDRAPDGTDYCAASPRYRWSRTLTPEELDHVARRQLAAHFGVPVAELGEVTSMEVLTRTESGRVGEVAFRGPRVDLVVSRLDIRRALPTDERILNSTDFEVRHTADGLVELHGRGYGHGAGMCQWGAIGRARAGHTYSEILAAYYPGAVLVNAYAGDQG